MYFTKIVFTGGPCAGKTTIIDMVSKYLKEKDCEVLVVPETATQIFGIGIRYNMINSIDKFQKIIYDFQRKQEEIIDNILNMNKNTNKKFIIIYDRGILDNKAYFDDHTGFDNLLGAAYNEIDYLDNYDMVFNLITLADCNPKKYDLSSNEARSEDKDLALKLDRKTSNAWAGHRNMNIINSSISIEEEFEIIKNKLEETLDSINTREIKTLELDNNLDDFDNYDDNNSRLIEIEENILNIPSIKDVEYKICKRTYKGKSSYIFNVSYKKDNKLITIYDSKISEYSFKEIISNYKMKDIIKYKQLSFITNRQEYNIKFYNNETILEYEENKLNNEFILPEPLKIKEKSYERKILLKPVMKIPMVKQSIVV